MDWGGERKADRTLSFFLSLFLLLRRRRRPPPHPPFFSISLVSSPCFPSTKNKQKAETVQPFDEGAAQVQRLLKRDRLELLGEGDSLEDFISSSEFADGDEDKEKAGSSSSASPSSSAAAAATAATAAPVSPFGGGATPTSPFGGSSAANAAGADSASLGGGLRGSVFGAGGAAGSPFAAGGLPTARGASGLYDEAERMPGEMNRGLFGDGDESFNLEQQQQRKGNGAGEDFSKLPWWSGITLSQVVIAGSFLFTISLMLATAWFVNSVGAIRFNE